MSVWNERRKNYRKRCRILRKRKRPAITRLSRARFAVSEKRKTSIRLSRSLSIRLLPTSDAPSGGPFPPGKRRLARRSTGISKSSRSKRPRRATYDRYTRYSRVAGITERSSLSTEYRLGFLDARHSLPRVGVALRSFRASFETRAPAAYTVGRRRVRES